MDATVKLATGAPDVEAQLGIGRQVADERDGGFACHVCVSEIGRGRGVLRLPSGPSDNR